MAKIVVPFFDLMEFVVLRSLDLRELDVPCSAYPELLVSISDNPDGKSGTLALHIPMCYVRGADDE